MSDARAPFIGGIVRYYPHGENVVSQLNAKADGNYIRAGYPLPAIIVGVSSVTSVNLKLFSDARNDIWLTSVPHGDPGEVQQSSYWTWA